MSPLSPHLPQRILHYILLLGVALYILNQFRKPSKYVGQFFLWIMNLSHSSLTNWGLQHVHIADSFTILDVGCGGGRTIEKLAALAPNGIIHGIDYAKGSVAASSSRNANSIKAGRVEIQEASVSRLPFAEDKFDLVTAVETQYYWPDLVQDMQEILRVLKPGGTLLIIAESYNKGFQGKLHRPVMKLLRAAHLSPEDHRNLFSQAGYTDIQIFEEPTKGWICALRKRPL